MSTPNTSVWVCRGVKTDKTYKEKSYAFDNTNQLKDFLVRQGNVIVDKVFEIKEEDNDQGRTN